MRNTLLRYGIVAALCGSMLGGCSEDGAPGANGANGADGSDGTDGTNGSNGSNGNNGADGEDGEDGEDGASSVVVEGTIPEHVRGLVAELVAHPGTEAELGFPVAIGTSDTVRTLPGLSANLLTAWLEPLRWQDGNNDARFGSHSDFIAVLGDGWEGGDGWSGNESPYHTGRSDRALLWNNFEYVDGVGPSVNVPPTGQHRRFARWLVDRGILNIDIAAPAQWDQAAVNMYVSWHKRQVGGAFFRVVRDESNGQYSVDRTAAANVRFDSTSNTLFRVTGTGGLTPGATDDNGAALPANVIAGTNSNCSGGVTPWGTIISAEENTQFSYGDLDDCYGSGATWTPGTICASGQAMTFNTAPVAATDFGKATTALNPRDYYGFLAEIDPLATPSTAYDAATGLGHAKLGGLGRAHWENATFAVGEDRLLVDGQPIVVYYADDRRGGRIYKWVSDANWENTMTRQETRALMESGDIYVAHFASLDNAQSGVAYSGGLTIDGGMRPTEAARGEGVWIHLSTTNTTQDAPNAGALGAGTKVGAALSSNTWNTMAGFPSDDTVRLALYSAANKIGVRELNRPEDLEWNPVDQRLYIAFTNHTGQNMLLADGTLDTRAAAAKTDNRGSDSVGAVFSLIEADPDSPGTSMTFEFVSEWAGTKASGIYDAANPDNIFIDIDGGVWFGTDGNYGTNQHSDAVYYLDVNTGVGYRVAAVPSDAEATGPAISPDGRSLFVAVQHPGEAIYSQWPYPNDYGARSGIVAITARR